MCTVKLKRRVCSTKGTIIVFNTLYENLKIEQEFLCLQNLIYRSRANKGLADYSKLIFFALRLAQK